MAATASDVLSMVLFARLVEARSFTAAAGKLGVSKSVVSARLSALEARLGTRLLHRTTRKLSLTPEGLAFYEHCARIAAEADAATATAGGAARDPIGVLRVNAPVTFAQMYLAEPVGAYLEQNPKTRVELVLSDRLVDLVEEGIDVAIRVSARLRDSSLVARKLAGDRSLVCAAPSYLAKHGTPQVPAELLHHACLRYALVKASDEWRFRDGGASFSVPVQGRLTVADGATLREAAVTGLGIAVLPSFMITEELRAGRLVTLLDRYNFVRLQIHALTPSGSGSAKVRAFIDLLADYLRSPPWAPAS
ncbi:MAG TPA: LysR family transcriptional regulator [Polyangiales bacterium]|nr:LysR family transcriptional regulator [Polyangiales bacterium]